jgi:hypothetical protein
MRTATRSQAGAPRRLIDYDFDSCLRLSNLRKSLI